MPISKNPVAVGKITVSPAGTPVRIMAAMIAADADMATVKCNRIMFQAGGANAGLVYIGYAGLVGSTGVGVLQTLSASTRFEIVSTIGTNQILPADFYVDAVNSNDVIYVFFYVA